MMYLRTRRALMQAIKDARALRAKHGKGLSFVRNVSPDDGAFSYSIWQGTKYIGSLPAISR